MTLGAVSAAWPYTPEINGKKRKLHVRHCVLFDTPIHLSLHMQTAWVAIIKSFGQ